MRVLKFGGTSVADGERIAHAAGIVVRAAAEDRAVVVVSALAGVTDALIAAADRAEAGDDGRGFVAELRARHTACLGALAGRRGARRAEDEVEARLGELSRLLARASRLRAAPPPVRDRILAAGERLSAPLFAAALRSTGVSSRAVDGTEVISTDSSFGEADVDLARTLELASSRLGREPTGTIPVVTGFVGADDRLQTTTLGRGGSDYTASLIGAALGAERVEIWTDVDGVLDGPPLLIPEAATVPCLSYPEAADLAALGGKVLHPKTMQPLAERGIPILVRNTFSAAAAGTRVHDRCGGGGAVRVVTAVGNVALFQIEGGDGAARARALEALPDKALVVREEPRGFSVAVPGTRADEAEAALARRFCVARIRRRDGLGVVAAVGEGCAATSWAPFSTALARAGIAVLLSWRASSRALCAVVDGHEVAAATRMLHGALVGGNGHVRGAVAPLPASHGRPSRARDEGRDTP